MFVCDRVSLCLLMFIPNVSGKILHFEEKVKEKANKIAYYHLQNLAEFFTLFLATFDSKNMSNSNLLN